MEERWRTARCVHVCRKGDASRKTSASSSPEYEGCVMSQAVVLQTVAVCPAYDTKTDVGAVWMIWWHHEFKNYKNVFMS